MYKYPVSVGLIVASKNLALSICQKHLQKDCGEFRISKVNFNKHFKKNCIYATAIKSFWLLMILLQLAKNGTK